MNSLIILCKRNIKIYFKDKGLFFCSLITPFILLVLYVTFLKNVYETSFLTAIESINIDVPKELINSFVGGQLVSSLLSVTCITVTFCSNLIMIKDKTSGAINDFKISPVKFKIVGLSYFLATLFSTLIINFSAMIICFIYLACTGWCLSFISIIKIIINIILLTTFGTALSSCINHFLTTDGQSSAAGTIVSAGYGFICGAYMPISSFNKGLQNFLGFLPGTYGTSLMKNCFLEGSLSKMIELGFPQEAINGIKDSVDCNLYFFGNSVNILTMYIILISSIIAFIGIYILINVFSWYKKNK